MLLLQTNDWLSVEAEPHLFDVKIVNDNLEIAYKQFIEFLGPDLKQAWWKQTQRIGQLTLKCLYNSTCHSHAPCDTSSQIGIFAFSPSTLHDDFTFRNNCQAYLHFSKLIS